MKPESMGLDQFLEGEEAKAQEFLAILEKDPEHVGHVRITPWSGNGCSCSSSLSVSRQLIASVAPTDKKHYCCGGYHTVVKIHFAEGAAIPVADVFKQFVSEHTRMKAILGKDIIPEPSPRGPHHTPPDDYQPYVPSRDHYEPCLFAGFRVVWCGRHRANDGTLISWGGWKRVPLYINQRTGQPCDLGYDPCG